MTLLFYINSFFYIDKCYLGHDRKQYSRGFSRRSDTLSILSNVNVNGSVTFKSDNSISTDLKKYATTKLG